MPLMHGELKVSNPVTFTMPTTSSPRRPIYVPPSYKNSYGSSLLSYSRSRAASLDRSSRRDATSSYRTSDTYSSHSSYKYNSSNVGRSSVLPPRGGISSLDTPRKFDTTADILSRVSSIGSSSSLKHLSYRKGSDAIHDYSSGNPILTNYKDLNEINSNLEHMRLEHRSSRNGSVSSRTSFGSLSSLPETSHISNSVNSSPAKASSTSVSSGSTSSLASIKTDVDENSNRQSSFRTRYDANHNLVPKNPSGVEDEKNIPSTSYASHLRHRSSSSSSSPASSTDDVSEYSGHRKRRGSALTGTTTSGYGSSDNASTSGSYSSRRTIKDSFLKGGLVGLRNLGNTCFMNSVLQCLSNTKPLLEYCLKESYSTDINVTISGMKGALFKAFANLMSSMWSGSTDVVNPQLFKNQIQKFAPRFMGYSQQDAQEFLRYLLQGLHEDVNRVISKPRPIITDIDDSFSESQKGAESWKRYLRMDDSKIVDIFVGQLKSTLRCTTCGHSSVTFDPFWDLSLPIPKAAGQVRMQQCFDLFTKEEILDGDEKPTCSKCKTRRKCTKSMNIHKFPKILVIHLKRFSPMERYRSKLSTNVDFPALGLDLSSYASNTSRSQPCVYNLYAVSNHSGTIYSGHYTAYCKHPYSGEWHDFNDSRVSSMTSSNLVSSEAYVLFYELANQSSRL